MMRRDTMALMSCAALAVAIGCGGDNDHNFFGPDGESGGSAASDAEGDDGVEPPGSAGSSSASGGFPGSGGGVGPGPSEGTGGGDAVGPDDDDDDEPNGKGPNGKGGSGGSSGSGGTSGMPGPLSGSAELDASSCDRALDYEVSSVRDAQGNTVANPACAWSFSDGGTSTTCVGTHEFASAGSHSGTVVVSDPATGAEGMLATGAVAVYDPIALSIEAQAPPCGLLFSYTATKTGGAEGWGDVEVTIEPAESVLTAPPWPTSGLLPVEEPGAYEISVEVEEERGSTTCAATASTRVVVRRCSVL